MKEVESIELRQALRAVAKPRFFLGTTYTLSLAFFESVVFPCFNRAHLRSCLIIADSFGYNQALSEAGALQGAAQDYMVVQAPVAGAFHPKVWLILGDEEAVLLVGSGNLTQSGFMKNAEFFDVLHFSTESPPSAELMKSIVAFVQGLSRMWPPGDQLLCRETLARMERALLEFKAREEEDPLEPRFLHSFQGQLISQIPPTGNHAKLCVAAPYFGNSTRGLSLLTERYPNAKLSLFPAVHQSGSEIDISVAEVLKTCLGATVAPLLVPTKKAAFPHLKLYAGTYGDSDAWLFCTSANCTTAAWQGPNVEAGLLRRVPAAQLAGYFLPGKGTLPSTPLAEEERQTSARSLHCWASDTGGGMDITVSSISRQHLPLSKVRITVLAGSAFAVLEKSELFRAKSMEHVSWADFKGWERRRRMTQWLKIQADDAAGNPVEGVCLIENRLLLTADPEHRSAMRGALAMLDTDGVPELADIAALFTMATSAFNGTLSGSESTHTEGDEGDEALSTGPTREAVAIWPPLPASSPATGAMGLTAHGRIQWFQRILSIYLKSDHHEEPAGVHHGGGDDSPAEDFAGMEQEPDDLDQNNDRRKDAERIWKQAWKDYSRIRNRLFELCPSKDNAPNIWPAAVFSLLSTLAVFGTVKRLYSDIDCGTGLDAICGDFLRVMFHERQQRSDFCCPGDLRYRRERFPALADDLLREFHALPGRDLATVVLALIVDRKIRNQPGTADPYLKRLLTILRDASAAGNDTRDACRGIWKRFVRGDSRDKTESQFESGFDEVVALYPATTSAP